MQDPFEIAVWRHEQIAPLIDPRVSRRDKRAHIRNRSRQPIEWPQSQREKARGEPPRTRPIGRATLYRWVDAYRKVGIVGLVPTPRADRGKPKCDRSRCVAFALALLYEDPDRTLTQLVKYLEIEFPKASISRSTLSRDLNAHPAYQGIIRQRKRAGRKLRDRIECDRPHECWQLDGKGPFEVRLLSGERVRVHVLTVLDAYSRFVLAATVARSENLAAAVRVFRLAAAKYGLADRFQFDGGSAFNSTAFRTGIGLLGTHRNWFVPRTPELQGKIEAYHRSLKRWFINELRNQEVVDLEHLEALLQASIALVYNTHFHRELKATPEQALAAEMSSRRVAAVDLLRPFWATTIVTSHAKTGEVQLPNGCFRVPVRYAGHRHTYRYDPVEPHLAVLVTPRGDEIDLEPFERKHPFRDQQPVEERRGTGQLQKLVDVWRGSERPNAQPGFGLPEVFGEIGAALGRHVPEDEREAVAITRFYRRFGPVPAEPFRQALRASFAALGPGRPLSAYLDNLARQIRAARNQSTDQQETQST